MGITYWTPLTWCGSCVRSVNGSSRGHNPFDVNQLLWTSAGRVNCRGYVWQMNHRILFGENPLFRTESASSVLLSKMWPWLLFATERASDVFWWRVWSGVGRGVGGGAKSRPWLLLDKEWIFCCWAKSEPWLLFAEDWVFNVFWQRVNFRCLGGKE